jgi:tRNA (guanine37-N1)-methyltransferase
MTLPWRATVLTLHPAMFPGPLGLSLAGDALSRGVWALDIRNIRDHGLGRHRAVDDTPAGGGPGMVLRPDVLGAAIDAAAPPGDPRPRLLMSPRGRPLVQAQVRDWAEGPGVVLVCGRFEGVDERVIAGRRLEEVSIGDYVLSGGETAALVLLDACVRLLPGVMGKGESGEEESFGAGLLEYPHYTRPREWEGRTIPPVLLGGDHGAIARWRRAEAERITQERRPDLLAPSSSRPEPSGPAFGRPKDKLRGEPGPLGR